MFVASLLYFANITAAVKSGNSAVCVSVFLPFLLLPLFSLLKKKSRKGLDFFLLFSVASFAFRTLRASEYVFAVSGAKTAVVTALILLLFAYLLSEKENAFLCAPVAFFLCFGISFYALIAGFSSPVFMNGLFCINEGFFGAVMTVSSLSLCFYFTESEKKIYDGLVLGLFASLPVMIINAGISLAVLVFVSNAFACAFELFQIRKVIFSRMHE